MFLFGVRPVVLSSKLILLAGRLVPGHSLFESELIEWERGEERGWLGIGMTSRGEDSDPPCLDESAFIFRCNSFFHQENATSFTFNWIKLTICRVVAAQVDSFKACPPFSLSPLLRVFSICFFTCIAA